VKVEAEEKSRPLEYDRLGQHKHFSYLSASVVHPDPENFGPPELGVIPTDSDPDLDPSIMEQKSKKNLDFYCSVTFFFED
jgi:hypothetical protein